MPEQGYDYDLRLDTRPCWGGRFQFGNSPVPCFALHHDLESLSDVLSLGAMPWARDSEDDGIFDYAFRSLRWSPNPSPSDVDYGLKLLTIGWTAAAKYVNPNDSAYVGQEEADNLLYDMATACFSSGAYQSCLDLGIPMTAAFLTRHSEEKHPLLRAVMLTWSAPGQLEHFQSLGVDFLTPMPFEGVDGSPITSLWEWLDDSQPNPEAAALMLIDLGNDPRRPISDGGTPPLHHLERDSGSKRVASFARALLMARDESAALNGVASKALSRRRVSGL